MTVRGPLISIGFKIFTVAVVVLMLMCAVTVLTVRMAADVSQDLSALGHGYVASYAALARANIRSLERALYLRRLYIARRDGQGGTPEDELARLAEQAATDTARELADAQRFIDAEIARGGSRHDIVALARIETLLQVIEEERARLATQQTAFLDVARTGAEIGRAHV